MICQHQGRTWHVAGLFAAFLVIASVMAGCLSDKPGTAMPTATRTPRPIDVSLLPTNTATLTPAPPTQPPATDTPLPEPSAILTPTATLWPTFGPDICPLTGLPVSDLAFLQRRPLAVKIQNAELSRPQAGLPQADLVFEHLSEAGITRFTGVYLCQEVDKIGSVRSARFIDLEIPAMYRSLLAFSGASPGLYPKLKNADFYDRMFWYDQGIHSEGFYRDKELIAQGLAIEHTLFARATKIWEIAEALGINQPQNLQGLSFAYEVPAGGEPAAHINIPFPNWQMIVDYRYDQESGAYLRWDGGEPHVDALTGKQLTATNVVVVYVTHVDADFYEDYPRTNHPSVQIQLWGTGPALIFRDGQVFKGLWARPKREDMVVFRDPTGQVPIPLKPGNTWIELVPLPGHRWSFEAKWDALP